MKYFITLMILSVFILPSTYILALSLLAMTIYFFIDSSVINFFKRSSTYLLFLIVVIIQPIVIGENTNLIFGVGYSITGLENGIAMFCRAIVIISSITILNHSTPKERVKEFWGRLGLDQFDTVFMKTQELLPEIKSTLSKSFISMVNKNSSKAAIKNPVQFLAKLVIPFLHKPNSLITNKSVDEE